jgi:hypothetical protein
MKVKVVITRRFSRGRKTPGKIKAFKHVGKDLRRVCSVNKTAQHSAGMPNYGTQPKTIA